MASPLTRSLQVDSIVTLADILTPGKLYEHSNCVFSSDLLRGGVLASFFGVLRNNPFLQ